MNYRGRSYYYLRNGQGDVVGLIDGSGAAVVEYTYDSWGKLLSTTGTLATTLGKDNPFRYRGYYYDNETGLYYLQSRYYDPTTGRFINADNTSIILEGQNSLLQYNLFSYCWNNSINMVDHTGEIPVWIIYAAAGAALFGSVTYIIGKALGITGWALAGLTTALAAIGATAAAILGVKFLAKVAPKLASWAQKVAKNTKFIKPSFSHKTGTVTNLGGIILFDAFKIMLHPPHHNRHNYFHIQIEVKIPGVKMPWKKFRIRINPKKWI